MFTIKNTYWSFAWKLTREMTFLLISNCGPPHTPGPFLEADSWTALLPQTSPHPTGAGEYSYVHLVCIHPKPCSKKGENYRQLDPRSERSYEGLRDRYSYKVVDTLYEVLLRLTVPALGFCRSSPDKEVIIAAEEGIL